MDWHLLFKDGNVILDVGAGVDIMTYLMLSIANRTLSVGYRQCFWETGSALALKSNIGSYPAYH